LSVFLEEAWRTTWRQGGGGNCQIWGRLYHGLGLHGVGRLVEVEGKMDANQYISILADGLLPSIGDLDIREEEFIFQQDNDPKHTSRLA